MLDRKYRFVVLAPVAALMIAACGGGTTPSDQAGGGEDLQAFCDAHFTAQNAAVMAVGEGTGDDEVQPLLDEMRIVAPSDVVEEVDAFNAVLAEAFQADDPFSVIDSPEFHEADDALDVYTAENCGYQQVEITAVEYEFQGLPDGLQAGRVAVTLTNGGEEVHEMGLGHFKEGADESIQEILDLSDKKVETILDPVFTHFTVPVGENDTEVFEVLPGRYGVVCFIPEGTTSLDQLEGHHEGLGKPHAFLGMFGEFEVEAA